MIKILVTSAGVMSAVNIIKALKAQTQLKIHIFAIDMDSYAPGLFFADKYEICPSIKNHKGYINYISDLVKRESIDIIFPCYSKEIILFSLNKDKFSSLGAKMLLPSSNSIKLCDDKHKSINCVKDLGIPVPKILKNPTSNDLPIFSKFSSGSGSDGAIYIENEYQFNNALSSEYSRIYQEYIKGREYTVDLISNYNSEPLISCPRERLSIKAGQSVKGITIISKRLSEYSRIISKNLKLVGICNIQFIKRDNVYYFIEVNPRSASGGLMLTVNSGVNLPLLAVKLMLNIEISDNELMHKNNISMTRFWEELILDKNFNKLYNDNI